ncbi:helix-turn-helix domain-containing protein [Jeotgalibacillus salarius]|uniref:Helix-turn-helix domain-containing protein n=1 Tax=Jeotgalibacillus salarius TaxID=546023 RepID=A0A4Y8LIH9_9BACL|nr:helix-turn-helix domain-containing protein [Jeotgalibacillus salarius]TFE02824.1 helix-turn-helix domain-containing protein [Jeotgalibacillus salarius]
MTELGSRLKEARESKGYSLEELQGLTKIQKRYLLGIEEGDYSMMPGAFYIRAFIKQYAEAVDLNAEELFETYSSDIPSNHDEQIPSQLSRVKTRGGNKSSTTAFRFIPTAVMLVFVIGIVALAWVLVQSWMSADSEEPADNEEVQQEENISFDQSDENTEEQENNASEDTTENTPAEEQEETEEPAEEPAEESLTVENTGSEGETTNYQVTSSEELTVTIDSDATWVGITDQSGNQLVDQMISSGNGITFDASDLDWFRIRVGSAPGTTVKINDQQVEFGLSDIITQNMIFQVQNPS